MSIRNHNVHTISISVTMPVASPYVSITLTQGEFAQSGGIPSKEKTPLDLHRKL